MFTLTPVTTLASLSFSVLHLNHHLALVAVETSVVGREWRTRVPHIAMATEVDAVPVAPVGFFFAGLFSFFYPFSETLLSLHSHH